MFVLMIGLDFIKI